MYVILYDTTVSDPGDMFRLTCFIERKWSRTIKVFSMPWRFSRIIQGDACTLIYGFDPGGVTHVELSSSVSGAKLITGINVVRRR